MSARYTLGCHRPRKRTIQYSRDVDDGIERPQRTGYPIAGGAGQLAGPPNRALAIVAFPINPKRFMVPAGFVIGKCRLSIDIKGLAYA
jgi:hypothetical protein